MQLSNTQRVGLQSQPRGGAIHVARRRMVPLRPGSLAAPPSRGIPVSLTPVKHLPQVTNPIYSPNQKNSNMNNNNNNTSPARRTSSTSPSRSSKHLLPPLTVGDVGEKTESVALPAPLPAPTTIPTTTPTTYTIVFDLDETLVSNRNPYTPANVRPHVRELLQALRGRAEIVLWTASIESVGRPVLRQLDPDGSIFQHAIYRHHSWFKEGLFFVKDLRLLGRDLSRTIIIENTPQCVRLNREHAILVPNYFGVQHAHSRSDQDLSMLRLKEILVELLDSREPVPKVLAASPLLHRTTEMGAPLPSTSLAVLSARRGGGARSGGHLGSLAVAQSFDSSTVSPVPYYYRLKLGPHRQGVM